MTSDFQSRSNYMGVVDPTSHHLDPQGEVGPSVHGC